jgi:hypothetical protein
MGLPRRARTRAVVAAVAVTMASVPCAVAEAAEAAPPAGSATLADATPPPAPTKSEVERAKRAAAAAAKEVAAVTAQVKRAEARLEALQRGVSEAVAAADLAREQLATAESAVDRATEDLAVARRARESADSALSASAALIYMQGGDLQNMTAILLSPPGVASDLAVVLDDEAHHVSENLDAASTAAADAASQELLLGVARDNQARALEKARTQRKAVEKQAARAGAEAAKLGEQQEVLTARLAELKEGAADLVGQREAAARLGHFGLLGLQANSGAPGVAQEIARSKMGSFGWDEGEFTCLVTLWNAESGWSWSATNPSSGAYGIPQALPGWKMASAGSDWLTNPATQIDWGMGYIRSVYGSPCSAYDRFLSRSPHWY